MKPLYRIEIRYNRKIGPFTVKQSIVIIVVVKSKRELVACSQSVYFCFRGLIYMADVVIITSCEVFSRSFDITSSQIWFIIEKIFHIYVYFRIRMNIERNEMSF